VPKDKNDIAWTLISLRLSGEADEQSLRQLADLIKTDPSLGIQLQLLEAWWHERPAKNEQSFEPFFEKLLRRLP
jgi:hypothetical protein